MIRPWHETLYFHLVYVAKDKPSTIISMFSSRNYRSIWSPWFLERLETSSSTNHLQWSPILKLLEFSSSQTDYSCFSSPHCVYMMKIYYSFFKILFIKFALLYLHFTLNLLVYTLTQTHFTYHSYFIYILLFYVFSKSAPFCIMLHWRTSTVHHTTHTSSTVMPSTGRKFIFFWLQMDCCSSEFNVLLWTEVFS